MNMKTFTAVIEKDAATGYYVAYVPDLPGAHTQAKTLEELRGNLQEVVRLVMEETAPRSEATFVGTQLVVV